MQPLRFVGRPIGYQPITDIGSVCVAVRKEAEDCIRVVHVETRMGELDDVWVSAISGQLKASKTRVMKYNSLKDDIKRRMLLKLRDMLEQRKLGFPSKYVSLLDDFREYSYAGYSPGYVLALGDCC